MVNNQGLQEDMEDVSAETIERVGSTGHTREVTEMDGYNPSYRVGPATSYETDFATQTAPDARSRMGDNIRDLLPGILKDGVDEFTAGGVPNPTPDGNKAPATGRADDPLYIVNTPANRVNTSQVALSNASTRIVYDANERLSVIIVNRHATNPVYVGSGAFVTSTSGFVIDPGASMTMAVNCELWGVAPAGATVSVMEFLR